MADITRIGNRARLAVRATPYWHRLEEGKYVGFRRMSAATAGTWLARYRDDTGYHQKPLGDLAHVPESERYPAARKLAEEWFVHLARGGSTDETTVKAACATYAAKLRRERSESAAKDAEGTFRRLVDDDPIGKVELTKLKPQHVAAWRERVLARGSRSYFNRCLTPLRAALNQAHDDGKASNDFAWRVALRPLDLPDGEGRRTRELTPAQRKLLIAKASAEFKPLLTAWALLPVRPGEIALLRVEHLDTRGRALNIPKGKTGARTVPLTAEAYAHFAACAKGKLPLAWLVSRADGRQWDRFAWREEMHAAVKAAKLPADVVAYTLRHSVITDLVTGGLDIFTVAKISGTSVAMIDKHYGKLRQEHARKALEQLSLN